MSSSSSNSRTGQRDSRRKSARRMRPKQFQEHTRHDENVDRCAGFVRHELLGAMAHVFHEARVIDGARLIARGSHQSRRPLLCSWPAVPFRCSRLTRGRFEMRAPGAPPQQARPRLGRLVSDATYERAPLDEPGALLSCALAFSHCPMKNEASVPTDGRTVRGSKRAHFSSEGEQRKPLSAGARLGGECLCRARPISQRSSCSRRRLEIDHFSGIGLSGIGPGSRSQSLRFHVVYIEGRSTRVCLRVTRPRATITNTDVIRPRNSYMRPRRRRRAHPHEILFTPRELALNDGVLFLRAHIWLPIVSLNLISRTRALRYRRHVGYCRNRGPRRKRPIVLL